MKDDEGQALKSPYERINEELQNNEKYQDMLEDFNAVQFKD